MSVSYFANFPTISYFNTLVPNITLRAKFIEKLKQESLAFYPYVVEDGETADIIATWYYGRPDFDWLIYLANDIVDPHSQWPKSYLQLQEYIKLKYGSVEEAMSNIEFYRRKPDVNYITVDGYDFSDTPEDGMVPIESNTDLRISPATYALIDDQINYLPVYTYDYETELNNNKKVINLVDNKLKTFVLDELRELING